MATITLGYHPELTPEDAAERLKAYFAPKYNVYHPTGFEALWNGRPHLLVRKNRWLSVALWLIQTENDTEIRFKLTWPPAILLGLLLITGVSVWLFQAQPVVAIIPIGAAVFASWSFLRRNGRPLEADISLFVKDAGLLGGRRH